MVSYPSINLVDLIIDEVALEGLDGITLEALWLRLTHRLHNLLPFSKPFMVQIWSICVQVIEFAFFELETAREKLVIFDRYKYIDPDLGTILEPEDTPQDIYPYCPINDTVNEIRGSCSTYYSRKDITELVRNLSLDEVVEKYGQKLVIVASQAAREHALIGDEVSPTLELSVIQYCFLERVGRSRYHGEITQGKLSLNVLKEDPRSLFYHRKYLLRHKLITKQVHHQKSGSHSCNGSLLHLPRFFVERKPKIMFLAEEIVKILKSKPNCVAEYDEIKRKLQIENSIKKLFKTSFFQKVVKTDIMVPYRTLYPNATPAEWQKKSDPSKEKCIKVVQLLSPNIDIFEMWNKDDIQEEDEPHELNVSSHKYGVPYLRQVNAIIEASGSEGVCQGSLCRIMGLTKLQSRTFLRNIVKSNIVATYMSDMGRQRLSKYVSKKYEKGSKLSKQFMKEMHKIKELTKQITMESDNLKSSTTIEKQKENIGICDELENAEKVAKFNTVSKDNEITTVTDKEEEESNITAEELQKLFYVVNRIFYKYRISKRSNRYKRTFLNQSGQITKTQKKEKDTHSNNMLHQISEISKNEETAAAYRNIRVDLAVIESINKKKSENEIYGFMEDLENSEKNTGATITYRLLRRANMIIEAVKEHQVIDDTSKLIKMIHEEEDKEGYDVKIDKKSLVRLLEKLAKDNLVKRLKVTISGNGREKRLIFTCDPKVDIDNALIKSAVEQAKLKFYLAMSKISMKPPCIEDTENFELHKNNGNDVANKCGDQSLLQKHNPVLMRCKGGSRISRKYGYSPKFVRMQALHIFLFYLVYEHPGEQTLSKAEQLKILRNNNFNITDELAKEFGTIYTKDVSWKMFIPPLPQYCGWPRGWALMYDTLLRLPLSIFLKIHYISFVVPEIDEYMNHPIRKHYLVKDLPLEMKNCLLHARKYIFHIHETVTRLCYIGLIQFGPQKLKEKDQVFIYVNRHTELLDTISSAPSYHQIEDKPYPVTKYNFTEIQVVEKYWYDMWNTCINTPLGGRLAVQGKDIVLEELSKKSDMIQAVVARPPDEAMKLDTGKVPGDRKGAAGVDSACFAHLKRNWSWAFSNSGVQEEEKRRKNIVYERDAYLAKIKAKPIRFTEFSGLKTVSGPPSLNVAEFKKKVQTKSENSDQQSKYEALTNQRNKKQSSYVRRVLPRKCSGRRRKKYDEVDYRALQRMHKLRVDWDPFEDKMLLVCKVAMVYLCPNPRKQVITFSTVRDILRTYSSISYNKTSRACQRRLLYILRQQRNVNTVALGVEELQQNFFLKKRFGGIVEKLKEENKNSIEFEKQVIEEFKALVAYIAKKYYDISDCESKEPLPVPMTAQEFNLLYKVVHPKKPYYNHGFTKDVRSINDIHSAVINSVIHSSMCCGKDRRSWAYQLFKVYQQYPESLLRSAMAKIRTDQMVTIRKNQLATVRKYGNYMPMSSCQYQLSNNYIYKFHSKWPYNIFQECYDTFSKLTNWYCQNQTDNQNKVSDSFNGLEVFPVTGGVIAAIHDYVVNDQIDFDIEIPDQIIMLDPRLQEKDETYFRIAKRYQDVLVSLDNLKFIHEPSLQNSAEVTDLEENNDKVFESKANSNAHIIEERSDKDGCSDMDIEKNTCLQTDKDRKRKIKDSKHSIECNELNFDIDEEDNDIVDGEKQNVIKFQDGTEVMFNKDDMDPLACCDGDSMTSVTVKHAESKVHNEDNNFMINNEVQRKGINEVVLNNLSKDECTSSVDEENKLIALTTGNKRRRSDDEEMFDLEEQIKKKKKLDREITETTKGEEMPQSYNVVLTELLDKTQNEDSKESTDNKTDLDGVKVKNEESTLNKEYEVSLQLKKGNEHGYTRISDILKKNITEPRYLNSYCKIDDSDVQKRYTRIALLRMREELSELTVADSHHAHEYFVVNMFKVFYSLYQSDSQNSRDNEIFRGLSLPLNLVPLKLNVINDIMQELSKFAVFPKESISYSDFTKKLPEDLLPKLNHVETVYKFVLDKKELGASIQELNDAFRKTLGEDLHRIVSLFTENYLFLRSGVTIIRYIHHNYVDAWLTHSYKIYRLEKESLVPIPKGTVYLTETREALNKNNITMIGESSQHPALSQKSESVKFACENETNEDSQLKIKSDNSDRDASSHSDEESSALIKKRPQRKKTKLLPQKDISKAAKHSDSNTKQDIKVAIKPWIRIDGALNRRVLDRMLGSVLSYCLTHPGVLLTKVQSRFVPPLQPCHTRELVEILVKFGCLEWKILKKPRVTLFSKPAEVKPKITNNDWAIEEDVFLEPASGAMLKFGVFLSTKMYTTDFIT